MSVLDDGRDIPIFRVERIDRSWRVHHRNTWPSRVGFSKARREPNRHAVAEPQQGGNFMSRHSLILGLLLLTSANLRADSEGILDERLHNFGVVPRGQQLTHYFRITNPTQKPMRLSNVRVSCGCTSARALSSTVPPGGETAILAVMDSRRFVGHKAVTIYVTVDQPRYEELRTVVQAYAREDLIFSPDSIAFGKIPQGNSKAVSMNITIYNGGVQVTDARSESNYVTATMKELRRTPTEATYQIEAKVRPDTPVGLWFSDIWVTTNNANFAKLRVPVTVEVEGLQPAQDGDSKKVEGTKTSRNDNPEPATPPAYQTAPIPAIASPASASETERSSVFSWFSFFRR